MLAGCWPQPPPRESCPVRLPRQAGLQRPESFSCPRERGGDGPQLGRPREGPGGSRGRREEGGVARIAGAFEGPRRHRAKAAVAVGGRALQPPARPGAQVSPLALQGSSSITGEALPATPTPFPRPRQPAPGSGRPSPPPSSSMPPTAAATSSATPAGWRTRRSGKGAGGGLGWPSLPRDQALL